MNRGARSRNLRSMRVSQRRMGSNTCESAERIVSALMVSSTLRLKDQIGPCYACSPIIAEGPPSGPLSTLAAACCPITAGSTRSTADQQIAQLPAAQALGAFPISNLQRHGGRWMIRLGQVESHRCDDESKFVRLLCRVHREQPDAATVTPREEEATVVGLSKRSRGDRLTEKVTFLVCERKCHALGRRVESVRYRT